MVFGAPLLLTVLAATGTLDLGVRSEMRGVRGSLAGTPVEQGVPYEIDPTVALQLATSPRLLFAASYSPRILLLAGPGGDTTVGSSSDYHSGLASMLWRASDQLQLTLSGAASDGVVETSPLAQLSAATAPVQPGQPAPPAVDPTAGVRTGHFSSQSVRAAADWNARADLRFGAQASLASGGGVGAAGRLLFPERNGYSVESSATWAATGRDDLTARAVYNSYRLVGLGSVALLGLTGRWDTRLTPAVSAFASAGVVDTVQDSTGAAAASPYGQYAPQFDGGLALAAPTDRPGVGVALRLGYAPYLNPYANEVLQRMSAQLESQWTVVQRLQLTAVVFGSQAVHSSHLGAAAAAAELGVRWRRTDWELAMGLRAGVQQGEAPATGTIRQWGLYLSTHWSGQTSL